ncbi:dihydroflavonol-4-reductase [Rhodopirellula rubra]|uniref:Dihydroflavonol-4-reductase n=1 Tax=Aporhodopirellula rubra TaxID=980271 RepID=A0A7W5DYQ6_9BACT|nr:NAD-dependent epimerase/dehydratase family protein [Aporhodopirellula rubra]MBB3206578.1 dihydroflavonol-4-reductase [Aporhodopirellula rubra]
MRIFVTGGSGLLGNTILRQLAVTPHSSAYMIRRGTGDEVFEGIDADAFHGDLSDCDLIDQATQWADVVIHSAGLIHLGWKRMEESMRVNAEGTRNLVNACLKNGCRLLLIGTVNTLAVGSRDQAADETTPLNHAGGQVECSYVVSKRAGVAEVEEGIKQGLQAVLLHPGFMLGPWDWKPSSGRMMLEVGRSWKPIAPRGGCSVCDSRDVADAIISAIDAEIPNGRSYVLAGHNVTYYQLWTEMGQRFGRTKPIMPAGPLQRVLGATAGDFISRFSRGEPDINSASVAMSSQFHWYDSTRAQTELGYRNRPMSETLDDAADWIRSRFH